MPRFMPSRRWMPHWTCVHSLASRSTRCGKCGSRHSASPTRSSAAARRATNARIAAQDVQELLRRVVITPDQALSERFPQRIPAVLEVELNDGTVLRAARDDYHGFHTNPFDWATARQKFDRVTRASLSKVAADRIADVIANLDERPVSDLTACISSAQV